MGCDIDSVIKTYKYSNVMTLWLWHYDSIPQISLIISHRQKPAEQWCLCDYENILYTNSRPMTDTMDAV